MTKNYEHTSKKDVIKHSEYSIKLTIKNSEDFHNINGVSPYSNKTELQRIDELNQNVNQAKSALDTFSEPKRISVKVWFRKKIF